VIVCIWWITGGCSLGSVRTSQICRQSTLTSGNGQEITVHSDKTYTLGSTVAAGWVYSQPSSTQGLLDDLNGTGHAGPKHLIIGPPDGSNTYSAANDSIAKTGGPHNPFLNQTATFEVSGPGITAATTVTRGGLRVRDDVGGEHHGRARVHPRARPDAPGRPGRRGVRRRAGRSPSAPELTLGSVTGPFFKREIGVSG
jgi:hypothetical protein